MTHRTAFRRFEVTPQIKAHVQAMVASGLTQADIARRLRVNRCTLRKYRHALGVDWLTLYKTRVRASNARQITPGGVEQVRQWIAAGWSTERIASHLDVTAGCVREAMGAAGIVRQHGRGRRAGTRQVSA